jgi:hypothetical protein
MRYVSAYQYERYAWTVRGQPIPAPRLTNARKYDPRLWRDVPPAALVAELVADAKAQVITRGYYAFKAAVVAALLDTYPGEQMFGRHMVLCGHPFRFRDGRTDVTAIVEYSLWMRQTSKQTCTHGDPDNIAKAILDALFVDDRHVLPRCMALHCGEGEPHVDILVNLVGA